MKSILILLLLATVGYCAQVRFFNALPDAINIQSVPINIAALAFSQTSPFVLLANDAGGNSTTLPFKVLLTVSPTTVLLDTTIVLAQDLFYTLVVYRGANNQVALSALSDDTNTTNSGWTPGQSLIRITNLSPTALVSLSISPATNTTPTIFANIGFLGVTQYVPFDPTIPGFVVTFSTGGSSTLTGPFVANNLYTIYAFTNGTLNAVVLSLDRSIFGNGTITSGVPVTTAGLTSGAQATSGALTSGQVTSGIPATTGTHVTTGHITTGAVAATGSQANSSSASKNVIALMGIAALIGLLM